MQAINCISFEIPLFTLADEKIEDFVRGKLGKGLPTRQVPVELLAQYMMTAGEEFGSIPLGEFA